MQITYQRIHSQANVYSVIVTIVVIASVLLGQPSNVEHFLQCRMEAAVYSTMLEHFCVSVPFDKLVGMQWSHFV